MADVSMQTEVMMDVDSLWEAIGAFGKLADWHPAIETSTLEDGGQKRRLALVGGGEIVEELTVLNKDEHLYEYSILSSPLPVANYKATLKLEPAGDGRTRVVWSSSFDAAGAADNDAIATIQGIYQAGFDSLQKMFGR